MKKIKAAKETRGRPRHPRVNNYSACARCGTIPIGWTGKKTIQTREDGYCGECVRLQKLIDHPKEIKKYCYPNKKPKKYRSAGRPVKHVINTCP